MPKIFSDLNLHGDAPLRVHPGSGEWGLDRVPSTAAKRKVRWQVTAVSIGVAVALCLVGHFFYRQLMGG